MSLDDIVQRVLDALETALAIAWGITVCAALLWALAAGTAWVVLPR